MIDGANRGIWTCWVYANNQGKPVKVWNRDGAQPPLAKNFLPVGFVTIQMDNT